MKKKTEDAHDLKCALERKNEASVSIEDAEKQLIKLGKLKKGFPKTVKS